MAITTTTVGVWAASQVSVSTTGSISYVAEDVYATITGTISGSEINPNLETLNYSATSEPTQSQLDSWTGLELNFLNKQPILININIENNSTLNYLAYSISDETTSSSSNFYKVINGLSSGIIAPGESASLTIKFDIVDKNISFAADFNYVLTLTNNGSTAPSAGYLLKGEKWQSAVTNAGYSMSDILSIEFTNTQPSSYDAAISVGATDASGETAWTASASGVNNVAAYISKNSSNSSMNNIVFYSSATIYAPTNSGYLFSSSTESNRLTNLTSISFNNFDTSSASNVSSMFLSCEDLKTIDMSNFDMTSVTEATDMLSNCSSLKTIKTPKAIGSTNVDLPSGSTWTTGEAEESSYTTISSSNLNKTLKVTENASYLRTDWKTAISNAGYSSSNIATITFTDTQPTSYDATVSVGATDISGNTAWNSSVSGVNDITAYISANADNSSNYDVVLYAPGTIYASTYSGSLFSSLKYLTSITFDNFDTSNVTDMNSMFYYCNRLTSLDVSSFDTSNVTDMNDMFMVCSGLTSLDLSNFNTSNVTKMYRMFSSCSGLTSLDLSNFNTSNVTDMIDMFRGCNGLTSLDLSNFDTSNVTHMNYMFDGCSNLTSLDVSNFNTSSVIAMIAMFNACSNLTSLDVSNFNTSSVIAMYYMFNGCSKLTSLNLSNFDTSKVTSMSSMFSGCSGLTSLNLSSFDTSKVTDMDYMFNACSKLTSLDVSKFDTSNVEYMSYMFYYCYGLTSLDLSSFDMSKVTSTNFMLNVCSALTEIKTPKAIGSTTVALPRNLKDSDGNTYTTISSENLNKTLTR